MTPRHHKEVGVLIPPPSNRPDGRVRIRCIKIEADGTEVPGTMPASPDVWAHLQVRNWTLRIKKCSCPNECRTLLLYLDTNNPEGWEIGEITQNGPTLLDDIDELVRLAVQIGNH